jgi:3-hydroxy-9,10-secoandrosta-1,3,5(10)-triene-9,17-dione monooxygenase reductase component
MDDATVGDGDARIELDPLLYRRVMGHFPTGVTVVAGHDGTRAVGLAIGSFFSVSLDPPLVGFCVARTSGSWPVIEALGRFGVSVLAEDQYETSGRFASKVEDKFDGITWEPAPVTGSPLIAGAVAHIDCELHDVLPGGDHVIVLGLVRSMDVHRGDVGPLLFFKGSYGRHLPLEG